MYWPAPRTPERVPVPLPDPTAEQLEYIQRKEKGQNWRDKVYRGIAGAAVTLTALGVPYFSDILVNVIKEAHVDVQVDPIINQPGNSVTFFSDGFNSTDGDYVAEKIGPAIQQVNEGCVASLNPGDAPPNFDKMAEEAVNYAHERKVTHISLFGYSMGGIEMLNVAERILTTSDITIDTIYLASTPDSFDSLLTINKSDLEAATKAAAYLPFSEHSKLTKFILNDYLSYGNIESAWQAAQSDERPSFATAEDQINLIKSDVEGIIQRIGQIRGKIIPKIIYLKIKNPSDNVVDEGRAEAHFAHDTHEAHVPFSSLTVEGTQHSDFGTESSVKGYTKTIKLGEATLNSMQAQQEKTFALEQWKDHFKYTADSLDPATIKLLRGVKQ